MSENMGGVRGFDEDFCTRPAMLATMDHVFRLAGEWFEKLHGKPMAVWRYAEHEGDWREADTGKRIPHQKWHPEKCTYEPIPGALDGREEICDGKRDHGGTMARFLAAHWALREVLDDMDRSVGGIIAAAVAYGWELDRLNHELPDLNVTAPAEIEIPDHII